MQSEVEDGRDDKGEEEGALVREGERIVGLATERDPLSWFTGQLSRCERILGYFFNHRSEEAEHGAILVLMCLRTYKGMLD